MSNLYYSSTNGQRHGRNSHFFRSQDNAQAVVDNQNVRAETLGVKVRYQLTMESDKNIGESNRKEIRD